MSSSTIKLPHDSVNVWFPEFYTEAHRTKERQQDLFKAFKAVDNKLLFFRELLTEAIPDVILCGTIWQSEVVRKAKYTIRELKNVPVIQYNWDLYPWQLEGESPDCWKNWLWKPYVEDLKEAAAIVVPSNSVVLRTKELVGRDDSIIVKAPVKIWNPPDGVKPSNGGYVVDVIRKYPDPNRHAVKEACDELGIECIETGANLGWDEFRRVILGATLLVSAYYEASTGGLTLLEGYAWGKNVLVSNSPYMGAGDYFGSRAYYFNWDDKESLKSQIYNLYNNTTNQYPDQYPALNLNRARWVRENYSDLNFAKGVADVIRGVVK